MSITKADRYRPDILDAYEVGSDGTYVFLTTTVVSTTSGTKVVVVSLPVDGEGLLTSKDHPVEPGDKVTITGTSGGLGDGTFTIASITSDTIFVVVEAIGTSTGGSVDFKYVPGAKRTGFDPSGLIHTTATNVEDAIREYDSFIVSPTEHAALRQLIHLADGVGGPMEAWASGAYRQILPAADPFPTSIIWWTDATLTKKIVSKLVTFDGQKRVTALQWASYAADGTTVIATVTDSITYSSVFEVNRTRTVT